MKYGIKLLLITILIVSCQPTKTGSFTVTGTIDGLKKGTLYLQKFKDTLLVSVDSVQINGLSEFTLVDEIDDPEIYYLTLDKLADEHILLFGEKGTTHVTSKLEKFSTSAKIEGSKNHELLEEHKSMIKKFNDQELDLIKERFEAQKDNDTAMLKRIDETGASIIKRKYLFTTNFAVNHADYDVAPYLALTELYYGNFKLLDTINSSLTPAVKNAKYGKELQKFIDGIKDLEKEN